MRSEQALFAILPAPPPPQACTPPHPSATLSPFMHPPHRTAPPPHHPPHPPGEPVGGVAGRAPEGPDRQPLEARARQAPHAAHGGQRLGRQDFAEGHCGEGGRGRGGGAGSTSRCQGQEGGGPRWRLQPGESIRLTGDAVSVLAPFPLTARAPLSRNTAAAEIVRPAAAKQGRAKNN